MENNKEKTDLRVRRTYKLLSEALIALVKEKPFEKITVMDICNRAMVHRATFYTHFEDKYQLLHYCIRELKQPFDKTVLKEQTKDGYRAYYADVAKSIFDTVEKNKDLYTMIFKKNKVDSMFTDFHDFVVEKMEENMRNAEENGIKMPVPPEILANFYTSGFISIANLWLSRNMDIPLEELEKYLDILISKI